MLTEDAKIEILLDEAKRPNVARLEQCLTFAHRRLTECAQVVEGDFFPSSLARDQEWLECLNMRCKFVLPGHWFLWYLLLDPVPVLLYCTQSLHRGACSR